MFGNIDRKNFITVNKVVLPLRAINIQKFFNTKKIRENKMRIKSSQIINLFDEIKEMKVDLSRFAKTKRRMKR